MQARSLNGPPARCNQVLEPVALSRLIWHTFKPAPISRQSVELNFNRKWI